MPEITTKGTWIPWSVKQPTEPGVYWWRLKSAVLPELTLIFADHTLYCNETVVPSFFKWDGWNISVPPCEWKPAPEVEANKGESHLSVEGLEFLRCPFCGEVPLLHGYQRADGGGVIIPANVQRYNCWWLKCCTWGGSPAYKDPREIERIRRKAFSCAKESSCPKN